MSFFALPWLAFTLLALLVATLLLREVFIAYRMPPGHPERRMAGFNASILALLLVAVLYGERILERHDEDFSAHFPRYPTARYAPERQLLGEGDWVYVTRDDPGRVVDFYVKGAPGAGYRVVVPSDSSAKNVFLSSGRRDLFLTVKREGDVTVLYFSASGTLSSYEVTGR